MFTCEMTIDFGNRVGGHFLFDTRVTSDDSCFQEEMVSSETGREEMNRNDAVSTAAEIAFNEDRIQVVGFDNYYGWIVKDAEDSAVFGLMDVVKVTSYGEIKVWSVISGDLDYGTFEADDEAEAIYKATISAGCNSLAHAADSLGITKDEYINRFSVERV